MDLYALVFRSFCHDHNKYNTFTMIKGQLYLLGDSCEWVAYEELLRFNYLIELDIIDYDEEVRNRIKQMAHYE